MTKKVPSSVWVTNTEKEDLDKIKASVSGVWHWTMRVVHHIAERGHPPPCIYLDIKRKKNSRREQPEKEANDVIAQASSPCCHCPAARAAPTGSMIEQDEWSELTAYLI